jgi:hypothetical protein
MPYQLLHSFSFTCYLTRDGGAPGFGDMWIISELNSSGTVVSSIGTNPPCWWVYPAAETFQGFNGSAMTQSCSTSGPGTFVAGTTYMITHGTWNQYCPWAQATYTFTYTPGCRGEQQGQFNLVEKTDAPDFSNFKPSGPTSVNTITEEQSLKVYPNPGNGIFNISIGKADKGIIEVYDMMGRNVKTIELNEADSEYKLDISGYAKGIYMLNMVTNGTMTSQKLILQ